MYYYAFKGTPQQSTAAWNRLRASAPAAPLALLPQCLSLSYGSESWPSPAPGSPCHSKRCAGTGLCVARCLEGSRDPSGLTASGELFLGCAENEGRRTQPHSWASWPPRTPFRMVEPLKYLNTHFQSRSLELSDGSFSAVMLTRLFSISTCTTSVPAD